MKLDWKLVLVLVMSLGLMVGCEETDDPVDTPTAFETLSKYMIENDLDATTVVNGWNIAASALVDHESEYFIVDVRDTARYNAGHIAGAVNSSYADVVTTVQSLNTADLPVVVACYSGQSAAHAVVALRLSGYSDAKSLLWGMSSWSTGFDSWSGAISSFAVGHDNWSFDAAPALPTDFDDPVLATDQTEGSAILAERVDAILAGFKGTSATTIVEAPENYQIINYWGAADYDSYGHIAGAYQVTPGSLSLTDGTIHMLNPSPEATIVTYCWTGQTSSMMTAWLTAVGYNATSLKNGANAMIYSELLSHTWTAPTTDLPME